MTVWEGLLLAVAILVAVGTLTQLMKRRADRLVGEVQKQVEAHRQREKGVKPRE